MSIPLSDTTAQRLEALFDGDDACVAARLLVEECGSNLPFLENADARSLERIRFAALKLSNGRLDSLREAIDLARTDWRDLLMCAGFGEDTSAHERWRSARRPGGAPEE